MKSNEERVMSIMKKVEIYKRKRGEIISAVTLSVCLGLAVVAGINVNNYRSSNIEQQVITNINVEEKLTTNEEQLITFASKDELINKFEKAAKEYEKNNNYYFLTDEFGTVRNDVMISAVAESTKEISQSDATTSGYSKTNIQTDGVDESDIIKTDGKRIYYMGNNGKDVKIFEDIDGKINLIKTIKLENDDEDYTYGNSMFLDSERLIIITQGNIKMEDKENTEVMTEAKEIAYIPYRYKPFTSIYIYDVNNYDLVRKVETEGNLVSSRKIGDSLYLVTNKFLYLYSFNRDDVMPVYKDTMLGNAYCEVAINNIRGFKDFEKENNCNYMIITSLDLSNEKNKVNIDTYLGSGSDIYCSLDNLFVTKTNYNYTYRNRGIMIDAINSVVDNVNNDEEIITTSIHKFAIKDGKATYEATGKVNGSLLNQFSMDEYKGNFRITTTDNNDNNLYVLDENLKVIGKLENLASGERIYSTRFMGDKAYVVTYKTVDPLFVIDLKNPSSPKVLGELKIPGYSSYLHPLGENYLLGFGEDSVEKSYINWEGKQEVVAYSTGLKMSIFDVSDYSNPKEIHSVKIGGRGSYSELLYNHKALLLDEDKKIIAFPASVNKEAGYYSDGTPMYGELEFSGALVYNIDVKDGFELKGKISHEGEDKYSKYGSNIQRIIYIGDKFYTISNGAIKSTNMNTMEEVSYLKFN